MGGGAFIPLNVGWDLSETAQQAEIRLAGLPTILGIPCIKKGKYLVTLAMVALNHIFCGIS
jgi:hypothetical protein